MGAYEAREGFMPEQMRTNLIKIFSYNGREPEGCIESNGETVRFSNLMELLILLEERQDALNYPKRWMEDRSLKESGDSGLWQERLCDGCAEKPIAAFAVKILFRQNASWQGSVKWLDENTEACFRSALELIRMIDGALSAK